MNSAIILAAGDSSRMGFPKQLAEYKGKTILQTVVDEVTKNFEDTIIVLGHENETLTDNINFYIRNLYLQSHPVLLIQAYSKKILE